MTNVRTAEPVIVELRTSRQLEDAMELLWAVWRAGSIIARNEVMGSSLLRTLAKADNYVAGAYRGGKLVGCCVGYYGADAGRLYLYSYISGVAPSLQNKGVGFALKAHQRMWALNRGIDAIRWTFDPLVRRNAYFNLCKLGATVTGYESDFYGQLDDGINTGDSTDRLLVEWALESEQVKQAMAGPPLDAGERSRSTPGAGLIGVPRDIEQVRMDDPGQARRLRYSVREKFEDLLGRGYRVVGTTRDGFYVLLPDGPAEV